MAKKEKRTDYSRISKRTDSMGVRFDKVSFERIQKDMNLKTAQQVVDFLMRWYDETRYPTMLNPVLERNQIPRSLSEIIPKAKKDPFSKEKFTATLEAKITEDPTLGGIKMANGWVDREKRIEQLEKELETMPNGLSTLARKAYIFDRNKEINQLKNEKT